MIKIFRKIKLNLHSDGNTTKYLKYAFGEIILVVVGILIALQINNWYIEHSNLKSERQYLANIVLKTINIVCTF